MTPHSRRESPRPFGKKAETPLFRGVVVIAPRDSGTQACPSLRGLGFWQLLWGGAGSTPCLVAPSSAPSSCLCPPPTQARLVRATSSACWRLGLRGAAAKTRAWPGPMRGHVLVVLRPAFGHRVPVAWPGTLAYGQVPASVPDRNLGAAASKPPGRVASCASARLGLAPGTEDTASCRRH